MGIVSPRIRKQVWRKCDGHCAYCGKSVELKGPQGFQVDHLHPTYWKWDDAKCAAEGVVRGPDNYENLMPACRRCNRWKSEDDIETYRKRILQQLDIVQQENNAFRMLFDYGVISIGNWDNKFYYERMSDFSVSKERITGK